MLEILYIRNLHVIFEFLLVTILIFLNLGDIGCVIEFFGFLRVLAVPTGFIHLEIYYLLISTAFVHVEHHLIRIQHRRRDVIIIIRRAPSLKHTLIFLVVVVDEAQPIFFMIILLIAYPSLHCFKKFIIKIWVISRRLFALQLLIF